MENGAKKEIKQESMRVSPPNLLWRQIWRNNRQAKIETQLIHQIGSLFIITLEGKNRSLNVKSG